MILKKQHAPGISPPQRSGCSTCHSALLSVALIIQTKEVLHSHLTLHHYCVFTRSQLMAVPVYKLPESLGSPSLSSPALPATLRDTLFPCSWPTDALASGFLHLLSCYDLIFPGSATLSHDQAPSRLLSSSRPSKEPMFRLPSSLFFQANSPPFTAPFPSLAPPYPATMSGCYHRSFCVCSPSPAPGVG